MQVFQKSTLTKIQRYKLLNHFIFQENQKLGGCVQGCRSLLSIGGNNLQFYPNFALFSTLGGMNFDHDFFRVSKLSEDQKKGLHQKWNTFSPEFKWRLALRCTPQSSYWDDIPSIPLGFRHPWQCG